MACGRFWRFEVPFAYMGRGVSAGANHFGYRDLFELHVLGPHGNGSLFKRPILAGDEVGQAKSGRVLSRHDRRPRRRANGASRVGVGEEHALGGQSIDIGRFVEIASKAAHTCPPEIVCQQEDNVGSLTSVLCGGQADWKYTVEHDAYSNDLTAIHKWSHEIPLAFEQWAATAIVASRVARVSPTPTEAVA
jgi:hypothetical protein